MSPSVPARFHWRAFVTLFVILSYVLLATSGIVLYVAPPGRVAHWSLWTLARLDKEAWQAVHTVFAFLFVLAGAFHLYLNWRIFWSYLRSKLTAGVRMKRELALASAHDLTPEQVWVALKGQETAKELPAGAATDARRWRRSAPSSSSLRRRAWLVSAATAWRPHPRRR